MSLCLEDGFHLRVASGPIRLLLCRAFSCQRVSSFVARHVAVGGIPLKGDCMASVSEARAADRSLSSVSLFD